jgi:hypothetical protein
MRPRVYLPALLALAALSGSLALPAVRQPLHHLVSHGTTAVAPLSSAVAPRLLPGSQSPSPTPSATSEAPVQPSITVPDTDFFGWALLNRGTGEITGSDNYRTGTNTTESMIKTWIVADYLRRLPANAEPDDATLDGLAAAIVHSDDNAAQQYWLAGGGDAVVQRMITRCGLTGSSVSPGWWSRTRMTPADAARLGGCLADGTAAGPRWTDWVLSRMRDVQGTVDDQQATTGGGRWGIIDGLPAGLADTLAIKNGWTPIGADGDWHVNNLAISDDWVLVVMIRYPIINGLGYGADICASVASQLLPQLKS